MIVFPMAGESARFRRAGFTTAKYALPLGTESILNRVVASFRTEFGRQRLLFVCRDDAAITSFVHSACTSLGLRPQDYQISALAAPTAGQAETVERGLELAAVPDDEPLTIFNVDTIRDGFTYPHQFGLADVDGYLEVFRAPGDHWSFVATPDEDQTSGRVTQVREKTRISGLCCTGLYYFARAGTFRGIFAQLREHDVKTLDGGEYYVAPMYNDMIAAGADVRFAEVDAADVILAGTPDEYRHVLASGRFGADS